MFFKLYFESIRETKKLFFNLYIVLKLSSLK